jgi:predicted glycosyltransferase
MRHAVFLVKNGIGFGHIRRALLIAEAVQRAGKLRPIIVSQASSLALYHDSPVHVINFPLLHRVPSAIAEDLYTDLLDRLLDRLDPAVVIEDTYPDARYRRLSALADRPRILIMRRLDGVSFDQIRQRGDLFHYERILIAQDEPAFGQEGHSGDSLAAVRYSGRFSFVGNIAHLPNPEEIRAARQAYAPDGVPLVVVNGGAGGDQMPDGYGDRLFHACQDIAATVAAEGHPAKFLFITGPYYAGRPLADTVNVVVRRFEPRLAALLAAADVAVVKPGNNALSEALAGHAQLVLVPDVSFMEGLDEHSARVVAQYGGAVGKPNRASLEPLIRDALTQPPRQRRTVPSSRAIDWVVEEIHNHANGTPVTSLTAKKLLLILIPPHGWAPDVFATDLPGGLRDALVLGDAKQDETVAALSSLVRDPTGYADAVAWDTDPSLLPPQDLADYGVRLLILPGLTPTADRWLKLQPPRPTVLTITGQRVLGHAAPIERLRRRIAQMLESRVTAALLVDLDGILQTDLPAYLDELAGWLVTQPVRLAGVHDIAAAEANRLLQGGPQ